MIGLRVDYGGLDWSIGFSNNKGWFGLFIMSPLNIKDHICNLPKVVD